MFSGYYWLNYYFPALNRLALWSQHGVRKVDDCPCITFDQLEKRIRFLKEIQIEIDEIPANWKRIAAVQVLHQSYD